MAVERVGVRVEADLDVGSFKRAGKEVEQVARDTGKRLDPLLKRDLELNVAKLQTDLDAARKRLKEAKKQGDKDAIIEARLDVNRLRSDTTEANRELRNYVNTGEKDVSRLGKLFGSIGEQIKKQAIAIGGALAVAFGVRAIGRFISSIDEARSTLVKLTGATGETLEGLQKSLNNVLGQVPQTIGEVANVIGDLNTRLGLSGEALEDLSKQLLDYARITGIDVTTATSTVSRLINALGIDANEASLLLDKLAAASQMSGIGVDRLANLITEAGPAFEQLGFDVDRSIALFAQFEKIGARPEEIISSLGRALSKLAKEGFTDAQAAFEEYIKRIEDAPTLLEGVTIANELFGAKVGGKVAEDIQNGRFAVEDRVESLQDAQGTLERTARESLTSSQQFRILANQLKSNLIPVIDGVLRALNPLIQGLITFTQENPKATKTVGGLTVAVSALAIAFAALGGPITLVIGAIGLLVGAGVGLVNSFNRMRDTIRRFNDGIIDAEGNLTALGKAYEEIKQQVKDYEDAQDQANEALERFNKIKTDKSATIEEFERLKQAAINAQNEIIRLAQVELQRARSALEANRSLQGLEVGGIAGVGGITGVIGANIDAQTRKIQEAEKALEGLANSFYQPRQATGGSGIQKDTEKAKKSVEELTEEEKKAKDKLKEIEKQMNKLGEEAKKQIGGKAKSSFEQLDDAIKESGKNLSDLEKQLENVGDQLVKIEGDIAQRILQIEKELAKGAEGQERVKLEQELALARANVNEELLEELKRQDALSETERLLEKQAALKAEQEELIKQIEFEEKLNQQLTLTKENLLRQYTETYGMELKKQEELLRKSVDRQLAMYRELSFASGNGMTGGNSTTNNSTINVNANINNEASLDSLVRQLS